MSIVSVIIPCYNAADTIGRAIASCQYQTMVGEIVVVDDASTDASCAIVERFAQLDARVRLLKMSENGGQARARNWGALQSQCDMLAFLDADDEYFPEALTLPTHALLEHIELSAVRLGVEMVDFPADICAHQEFAVTCQVLANTFAGNLLVRKEMFFALGAFPQAPIFRTHGGEDGALSLAGSTHTLVGTLYTVPGVRIYYHPGAHSERFFRIKMAGGGGSEDLEGEKKQVWDTSMQFVHMAGERLKRLQGALNQARRGFAPLTPLTPNAQTLTAQTSTTPSNAPAPAFATAAQST